MTGTPILLLVTGCPRSGTTALTKLLNTHPDVAIGMERFTRHLNRNGLERDLFLPERFRRFEEGDGNRVSFDGPVTRLAREKVERARVVGDKSPNVLRVLDAAERLGDVTVLAIVREPMAVARSFQRRATRALIDPEAAKYWPATRDRNSAVSEFNTSMAALRTFLERGDSEPELAENVQMIVVCYEDLFFKPDVARRLFERLGLCIDDAEGADAVLDAARELEPTDRDVITDQLVAMQARFNDYRSVVRHACAAV